MPRQKLTPEEREARRKERNHRSFSDAAYRHYDTSEGYGSTEEWIRQTEEAFSRGWASGTLKLQKSNKDGDLLLLGLDEMPTLDGLKKAMRRAMLRVHPDVGGTTKQAQEVLAAYHRLLELVEA